MGQGEVQNWMRSTPDRAVAMRYPGEWKFAGGTTDAGETPEQAARRELQEEFLVELPADLAECKLRLLSVMQTKPVRNISYVMHNFVAVAEENPWLSVLDACAVNAALEQRRVDHAVAVENGSFWALGKTEKERLAPEVREVRWLDMRTAVVHAFTSMNKEPSPVNKFQGEEFARLGLAHRDPMFVTMAVLLDVDSFPSAASFFDHEPDPEKEVAALSARRDGTGVFRTPEERRARRVSRAQAAPSDQAMKRPRVA